MLIKTHFFNFKIFFIIFLRFFQYPFISLVILYSHLLNMYSTIVYNFVVQ